ncbi:ribosomal RNA large subunit methyltransferase G [Acrocarpospora phusangensis]|uniref:Ribosomal RNA large subunit methyltransferase G n=1 Tax=Acrocarpospora phusangensis TaxID=1070424 RepID=A0A919UQ08_9ACTN|nr:methyltransferase [Acrocarpospora phusangensis]GIH25923.1 ribosomal RNA large subunit methyltransferase G [Acrocarpospora phusangensis]
MNSLVTPVGEFELDRATGNARDGLRAWDAADEYLLRHLAETGLLGPLAGSAAGSGADSATESVPDSPADSVTGANAGSSAGSPAGSVAGSSAGSVTGSVTGSVAVFGDRWGAIATALAAYAPVQISDSFLAQRATRLNLERNGVSGPRLLSTLDDPPGRIDVLLVRVPKSLALLEDQLRRLAPSVHAGTVIVGAGMVTEIHTSTLQLFERVLGPTRTSLAVRKARLIFCTPDPAIPRAPSPWPRTYRLPEDAGPVSGRPVTNHAGVFCADRLDIGTRFLLRHLPARGGQVVDLGCGNGVVGLAAALAHPEAELTFVDESYHAVASAEATFRAATDAPARFLVSDGMSEIPARSVDLVLNNPPFHSHRAIGDATAWEMFTGSRRALRPGGELYVVGNRHLGYHVKLRRLFGNCELVASDPKFVVLRAVKREG